MLCTHSMTSPLDHYVVGACGPKALSWYRDHDFLRKSEKAKPFRPCVPPGACFPEKAHNASLFQQGDSRPCEESRGASPCASAVKMRKIPRIWGNFDDFEEIYEILLYSIEIRYIYCRPTVDSGIIYFFQVVKKIVAPTKYKKCCVWHYLVRSNLHFSPSFWNRVFWGFLKFGTPNPHFPRIQ